MVLTDQLNIYKVAATNQMSQLNFHAHLAKLGLTFLV